MGKVAGDVVAKPHPMAGMQKDTAFAGGVTYAIGDVSVGVGIETMDDAQNVVAGAKATLGNASVALVYGSHDPGTPGSDAMDSYGASASFASGLATFTAFASNNGMDQDHFGLGMAYDLGGNAKLQGGFVDGDSLNDGSFDLGVSMAF